MLVVFIGIPFPVLVIVVTLMVLGGAGGVVTVVTTGVVPAVVVVVDAFWNEGFPPFVYVPCGFCPLLAACTYTTCGWFCPG